MSWKYEWHRALNKFNQVGSGEFHHWMYDAKDMSNEVPRMTHLFKMEREGTLPKIHRQCSQSDPVPVVDNKLTCAIGTVCKTCKYLQAIDAAEITSEQKDEAKAWTCAAHMMTLDNIDKSEGWLLREDDKMFWSNLYESMSAEKPG